MIQIETILDILVKGFVIGIVVSAPLGPVGVLCIQRTLNKGRWYGFVTGLGASLSDIAYALLYIPQQSCAIHSACIGQ